MQIQCPSCFHEQAVKNGFSRHGHQRYRCKACGVTFGEIDHRVIAAQVRENALRHYAEGIGLRATERLVGPSHNSIMRWVREAVAGKALVKLDAAAIEYIEADELWSYVGQKKHPSGSGGLLIALPEAYSAGRWAIVTPEQPGRWARKFLAALISGTAPIAMPATERFSPKASSSRAKLKPAPPRA